MADIQLKDLKPMTDGVAPITVAERHQRIEKARKLMRDNNFQALFLEAGSSLVYFTGIDHWLSERLIAAVMPAGGGLIYVCPAFEEAKFRQMMSLPGNINDANDDQTDLRVEVRVWEEDESPYEVVAGIFKDYGVTSGNVGVEETVRYFVFDGIRKASPLLNFTSGDAVTIACRAYKSPAEIALMQRANEITVAVYKYCIAQLHEGMSHIEFAQHGADAYKALGAAGGISAQFGASTAYPHGDPKMGVLREGDSIQFDSVGVVQGYRSDISRSIVFGPPTQRQREVWNLEKRAQAAAFAAAQLGAPCEAVDAAARKVITEAGFGPDYRVPGLPHRTGHGIGLDTHEWHYLVRGNKTPLAPGLCFTNEPMICIYGEFGVRLEDCFYMTEAGPRWFTQPSPSIEQPFA